MDFTFKKVKDGNPVFTSEFYVEVMATIFENLMFELKNCVVEGRGQLLLVRRLDTARCVDDGSNENDL